MYVCDRPNFNANTYVRENVWGLYKIVPGVKLLLPLLLSLPLLHIQFPLRLFQYQWHFYHSCNKCYPCRSSCRTTENLSGICNDNFQRYFHSRGYIHLHCVVYIHLRLRREYIIQTVTNLRKLVLNTKKEKRRRKRNKSKQEKQKQQQQQQHNIAKQKYKRAWHETSTKRQPSQIFSFGMATTT